MTDLPGIAPRSVGSPELRALRRYTPARVALARTGSSIATEPQLRFQLDHALARDAVHATLDVPGLVAGLKRLGLTPMPLRSAVPAGADERRTYLRRPDLGRRLAEASAAALNEFGGTSDVVFAIADGLSALAVERHAVPVLESALPLLGEWRVGPVCVVQQGRVAVGDEIGALLKTQAMVMLIGERPGLSSADSLGVYVTWLPRPGRTDAERNCISNIRLEGLSYAHGAERIVALLTGARRLGASGVQLASSLQALPAKT